MALAEYWVTFSVLDTDAAALEEATGVEDDPRVGGVVREEPSEGTAMVVFQILGPRYEGEHSQETYNEALEAYARLRRNAHLPDPDAPPGMATITHLRDVPESAEPPKRRGPATLPHAKLLLKARTVYARGQADASQYAWAIVVAQAACEVAITDAMRRLVAARASSLQFALEGLVAGRYGLTDDRVARLWDALADDAVGQAPFWGAYRQHLKRRNTIVHEGASASRAEASESLEAAQGLCDHVSSRSP